MSRQMIDSESTSTTSPWPRFLAAVVSLATIQAVVVALMVLYFAIRSGWLFLHTSLGDPRMPLRPVDWYVIASGLSYGLFALPVTCFIAGMVLRHRTTILAAALVAVGYTLVVLYVMSASYIGDWDATALRVVGPAEFVRWLVVPAFGMYSPRPGNPTTLWPMTWLAFAAVVGGGAALLGVVIGRAVAGSSPPASLDLGQVTPTGPGGD